MINKPKNWENVQAFTDRPKLPVGAYVCRVKQAVVQDTNYGPQLCLLFDIEDGEYTGFYADDFAANQRQDKKWKGVLRQWLPKDDGSEKDEWTKSSFKALTAAIEDSNRGYTWDWEEKSLAGKLIGIIFRNEEWEYEGKTGWTVRPFKATSVDAVQDGNFTVPKDKPLKNKSSGNAPADFGSYAVPAPGYGSAPGSDFTAMDDSNEELPF